MYINKLKQLPCDLVLSWIAYVIFGQYTNQRSKTLACRNKSLFKLQKMPEKKQHEENLTAHDGTRPTIE